MRFQLNRATFVSAAASMVGIVLVVNAVYLMLAGQPGNALMRAGLGLYCCIWAFVPYDEFFRVIGMRVRLGNSPERKAYTTLFPARLLFPMFFSMVLIICGLVCNVANAFR
jgi:hypothetical protein